MSDVIVESCTCKLDIDGLLQATDTAYARDERELCETLIAVVHHVKGLREGIVCYSDCLDGYLAGIEVGAPEMDDGTESSRWHRIDRSVTIVIHGSRRNIRY